MKEYRIFSAGDWITGSYIIPVYNKYNGELLAHVHGADETIIQKSVEKAKNNFSRFSKLSADIRYQECLFIASELKKRRNDFALTIAKEAGKPLRNAEAEVDRAILVFTLAAEEATRLPREYIGLDRTVAGRGKEGLIRYFPSGPVAGISPFNFPLNLAVHKIAPAFAAGCPILLKPSSLTPLSTLLLAEIVQQTEHLKHGLFILPSDRKNGNLLVEHPDIRILSFTGSPEVGWKMKQNAGKKKVILELGGNAAVVIDKDTDIQKHLSSFLTGAFSYSGQICIHAQRFIVHKDIYESFKNIFIREVSKLKSGDPCDASTDYSVLIDEPNAERIESWISEAVQTKANLLTGGKRINSFVEATVLENVLPDCKVYKEEVFGPVITLEEFTTDEEAIRKVNASRFGLQCGIYTNRIDFLKYCFEEIEVGGIIHNQVPTLRFDNMPYGGMKDSGLGREGVSYAVREYMEPRILVW